MSQRKWAGVVLALGVALSGCGGDDDQAAGSAESPGATAGGSPQESPGSGADNGEFCAEMERVADKFDVDPDASTPQEAIQELDEAIQSVQDVEPPAELADEWATVTSFFESVQDGLEGLDATDPAELEQQLEDLGTQLEAQQGDFEAAAERVDAYLEEECGITTP
ncbi:MAG: hypothetical protein ICV70_04550 [Jiangellaceae bacterium]|nr:hypothetical protein [Jiangellaceae bacterium]